MLHTFVPVIVIIGLSLSPNARAHDEKFEVMSCESAELFPGTRVPAVTLVVPKVYQNHVHVLLLTVRKTMADIPTGYSCRVERLNEGGTELMDFTCVSQDQKEQLKVYVSKSDRAFVANLQHRRVAGNSRTNELNNLTCYPHAPRVTRNQ